MGNTTTMPKEKCDIKMRKNANCNKAIGVSELPQRSVYVT